MTTELPIDREIEMQIEALDSGMDAESQREWTPVVVGALQALVDREGYVALFGMTRKLVALEGQKDQLANERRRINEEYDRALATLALRSRILTGFCEDIARARRSAGMGATTSIPGVGSWSTRKVPKSWELKIESKTAQDAVMRFLREQVGADEAAAMIQRVEEVDKDALRAWLDTLDDETYVPVHEALGGYIAPRPERVSVSFSKEAGR